MTTLPETDARRTERLKRLARVATPFVVPSVILLVILLAIFRGSAGVASAVPAAPGQTGADMTLPDGNARGGVRVSLAEVFFIQRHPATREVEWLGSAIVWFLLALSATSVALMAALTWETRPDGIAPRPLLSRARGLLRERRVDETMELARAHPSYLAEVLLAALAESDSGDQAMSRAAAQASQERAVHRLRRMEPLNIIGNVAPMIGLFGTVYGMILAFREIVAAGGTPDPVGLAAGIGTALVTTFWGLIVAIPALAVYAVLRNKLDELTSLASRHAEDMLNHYRGGGPPGPPGPSGASGANAAPGAPRRS